MVRSERLELPKWKSDVFQSRDIGGFEKNYVSVSNNNRIFLLLHILNLDCLFKLTAQNRYFHLPPNSLNSQTFKFTILFIAVSTLNL